MVARAPEEEAKTERCSASSLGQMVAARMGEHQGSPSEGMGEKDLRRLTVLPHCTDHEESQSLPWRCM